MITFEPFQDKHVQAAGAMLAARHRQDRERCDWLPARFEQIKDATQAVEHDWKREGTTGVAAFLGGELVGFLLGQPVQEDIRGNTVWMRYAGHAVAAGYAELYRDLYAQAAGAWVEAGYYQHILQLPAGAQPEIQAWFQLCFGLEQVHAVKNLEQSHAAKDYERPDRSDDAASSVTCRLATTADREALRELSEIIWRQQVQAPVWAPAPPAYIQGVRAGYAGLVDDETATVWLACEQQSIGGFQVYFPCEPTSADMFIPDHCTELAVAGTRAALRGRGIGKALSRHGFRHAWQSGFRYCLTDWRAANLQSSRFWSRQGFAPTMLRLVRTIDPQIAWANGKADS